MHGAPLGKKIGRTFETGKFWCAEWQSSVQRRCDIAASWTAAIPKRGADDLHGAGVAQFENSGRDQTRGTIRGLKRAPTNRSEIRPTNY